MGLVLSQLQLQLQIQKQIEEEKTLMKLFNVGV